MATLAAIWEDGGLEGRAASILEEISRSPIITTWTRTNPSQIPAKPQTRTESAKATTPVPPKTPNWVPQTPPTRCPHRRTPQTLCPPSTATTSPATLSRSPCNSQRAESVSIVLTILTISLRLSRRRLSPIPSLIRFVSYSGPPCDCLSNVKSLTLESMKMLYYNIVYYAGERQEKKLTRPSLSNLKIKTVTSITSIKSP